jgi:hypothetical protein
MNTGFVEYIKRHSTIYTKKMNFLNADDNIEGRLCQWPTMPNPTHHLPLGTHHDPGFSTLEEARSAVMQCLELQPGLHIIL